MDNSLKQKIRAGEPIISAMMRFPDPGVAELLAVLGFDVVIIDNEHMPFNEETVADIVRAANLHGVPAMIRPADHNPKQLGRLMDTGVAGILAAHVDTLDQARQIVDAVKYPPVGRRGMMPLSRAARFGEGLATGAYAARANEESVIICMCESKAGVENIDRILGLAEIDGIAVGPSDIANSYGRPGMVNDPEIERIIDSVEKKVLASGKLLSAIAKTHEDAVQAIRRGFNFINAGSDLSFIVDSVRRMAPRQLAEMKVEGTKTVHRNTKNRRSG